jgi:hypothetical protein
MGNTKNTGVDAAQKELSKNRILQFNDEKGRENIRKEYTEGFTEVGGGMFFDADVPDELMAMIQETEINLANSNEEQYSKFSIMSPKKKTETIVKALGNPEVRTSMIARIAPFVDDVTLRKIKDGKIEDVTGSLSDQVSPVMPAHVRVMVELIGLAKDFDKMKDKK